MVQELGQRIEEALANTGLKQAKIAELMNVTPQAVNKWIKTGRISKENLRKLAKITGAPLTWLISGNNDVDTGIEALLNMSTPRSRESLLRIARAAESGRLTEDDLALLEQIAKRFAQE